MIEKVNDYVEIPPVAAAIRRRRPEGAFARREMQAFLDSGYELAEVTGIPEAYDAKRLYEALKNAAWSLCDRPRSVAVIKRGKRIFLSMTDPLTGQPRREPTRKSS